MGCGGSRLASGSKPTGVFPTRLRPLFLLHMRHPSSPKMLLDEEESCSVSQKYGTPLSEEVNVVFGEFDEHGTPKLEIEDGFRNNQTGSRDEPEFEDALADEYEDEDEDKRRMIGHQDNDGAFPGSPTFRHFCKDDDGHDLGKIYAISSDDDDDDTISSKENNNDENNKVKKGRKRNSFKKVLPKGAMKKLLSVKSYYNRSSSSRRHNHLVGKTVA